MTAKELLKEIIDECYESGSNVSVSTYSNVGADIVFWRYGRIVYDIAVGYSDITKEKYEYIMREIKSHKKSQSKGLATD